MAEAEAWSRAPRPNTSTALALQPFTGGMGPPGRPPAISWLNDQMPPPPPRFSMVPGYNDHTYQQYAAPFGFENIDLDRIHRAVAAHRLGYFWESSSLMVAIMGFAPVLAALQQAIAPILALPRRIVGGDKGLAKLVASELEAALVSRGGLLPSPYLPPSLWGTMAIYLRIMGFCVLQHVDGDPDPETGVRPRYTRIWEPWAVNYYRSPRKWIAITTEGNVEIKNDGKFTLVCDEQEPHFTGAIVALGDEVLGGRLTQAARWNWLDFFGNPKLYATLPEKVPTHGEAGNDFADAVDAIYGPDGRGVLPYGSTLAAVSINGQGASQFREAIVDAIIHISMILLGSDGTISAAGPDGAGAYRAQKGGFWQVRHDLISRPTICIVRALNQGHVAPYCDINYGDQIERAKRAGAWKDPVLDIPLVDPERDARIESAVKRQKALTDQVVATSDAGGIVDQDLVNRLATQFDAVPFVLAQGTDKGAISEKDMEAKLFAPDEYRAARGYEPLPDGAGSLDELVHERKAGRDKIGQVRITDADAEPEQSGDPHPEEEEAPA